MQREQTAHVPYPRKVVEASMARTAKTDRLDAERRP